MTVPARRRAERRGRRGESLAALWLMMKGWRILERRARTPAGEIDLVAARGGILAFVEVKSLARRQAGLHALGPRQQARLIRAAALWRAARPRYAGLTPRFDLVTVPLRRMPRHLAGAFRAEGRETDLI